MTLWEINQYVGGECFLTSRKLREGAGTKCKRKKVGERRICKSLREVVMRVWRQGTSRKRVNAL